MFYDIVVKLLTEIIDVSEMRRRVSSIRTIILYSGIFRAVRRTSGSFIVEYILP